jgi:hypothetical protein
MAAVDVVGPDGERGRMTRSSLEAMRDRGWREAEPTDLPAAASVTEPGDQHDAAEAADPTPIPEEN